MNPVSNSLRWLLAATLAVGVASTYAEDKKAGDARDTKSGAQETKSMPKDSKSAQDTKGVALSRGDRNSMEKMAQADMAEIEAGKVAQQKAANPEVKKFAEHMVQEHSKSLEEGRQLASSKGMNPPAQPDRKHESALDKLQKSQSDSFDRLYMRQMVQDHEDALKLVKKTAKDAKDPELKAHAEKLAPHIEEHLAQARKLSDALAGSDKRASGKK